jgi:multiple sugar transport system permease protein
VRLYRRVDAEHVRLASHRARVAYALLAPAVALLALVVAYPLVAGIILSFERADFLGARLIVQGLTLQNYLRALSSSDFVPTISRSLTFVLVVTGAAFAIGLLTALLVNERFGGRSVARTIIVLPWAIPLVVATNIWWWLLDPSYGLVNYLLLKIGVSSEPVQWLSSSVPAFLAVCLVTTWKGYPFFTIMLLAGLQAIPRELYEAANVDGASSYRRFWHITAPALRSVAAIAVLLNALWVFREFTVIWVLTGGGPVRATETLAIATYRAAFQDFQFPYAAALGVITLIVSLIGSIIAVRTSGPAFY